ncbi:hypothetical protein TI39_contig374g00028 [Zymoseptoria brevis]|uniref:DUF7708 domain-containing protein n=1 Tax=Zymoseptoria brevis TaxID=1047168 RepID=A0A0F4GPV3_9PEZI|nr:hypothetical protein TI39_contig374g00028 [Zymoseptoria brevis]
MSLPPHSRLETSWFRPAASDSASQQYLITVKATEDGHRSFRNQVKQILGGNLPKHRVTNKDELVDQLRLMSPEELGDIAHGGMRSAEQQKQSYTDDRKHGPKKVGAAAQRFFKSFADFIEAYSGVAHLVRSAGAPYGEAAFETLSLLLIVVDNKATNDIIISDLMQDLATAFPRLDVLMDVYPSPNLRKCVATVYVSVIKFAREATEYFASFGNRLFGAFAKPPAIGLEAIARTIQDELAEVNSEAMIQLHARNKKILQQVEELEEQNLSLSNSVSSLRASSERVEDGNVRLETQNATLRQALRSMTLKADMQAEADQHDRLEGMANALGLKGQPDKWPETDPDGIFESLMQVFPGCSGLPSNVGARHRAAHFQHMTAQRFFADENVKAWQSSAESTLLFLNGRTDWEGRMTLQQSCSWISPGAVFTARHASSTVPMTADTKACSDDFCMFYGCHPEPFTSGIADHDILKVFGVLAWSICKWRPAQLLTEETLTRARQVAQSAHSHKAKRDGIKILISFIVQLLASTGLDASITLWLILDRPDVCDVNLCHTMTQLARLLDVRSPGPRVKILVVSDLAYPGVRWDHSDIDAKLSRRVLIQEWNQRRTTAAERSLESRLEVEEDLTAGADRA